jgi:arginine-tRNA-protein transferase
MVSIIDILNDGVSSVYTFYDPDLPSASFGTYNILWQIAQCSANKLPYLYLGYWIRESRKMSYKAGFRPIEGLLDGVWQELPPEGNATRTT